MSEADYRPVDEILDTPPKAREEAQEPRTRSVRRPAKGRGPTTRRTAPKSRTRKPPPAPETSVEDSVRGIFQIPAAGLIITGQRIQSVPLVADGATVLIHGPGVAKAIAEIAEHDPRVMALLEKVLAFGPYGILLAALFPMAAQFGANHGGPMPILSGFGAVTPEEVIAAASLDIPVNISGNGQATAPDGTTSEN